MVLLDTCSLLWLASDPDKLSPIARNVCNTENLAISAITTFEITAKAATGKLALLLPPQQWLALATQKLELVELPLTGPIAAAAALLPQLHRDIADRLLIATALHHHLAVVTPDAQVRQYPLLRTVW